MPIGLIPGWNAGSSLYGSLIPYVGRAQLCPPGLDYCGGACRNTSTDPSCCGDQHVRCTVGQACCGGICRSLTSPSSCGGCGVACRPGEGCCFSDARKWWGCEPVGNTPERCGPFCRACGAGEDCCVVGRRPGVEIYDCVPLDSDHHCGRCENRCLTGTHCVNHQCICPSGAALGSDTACASCEDNCLAIGKRCVNGLCVCPQGTVDCAGACCQPNEACCGSVCRPLGTDTDCARCGDNCRAAGKQCVNGRCVCPAGTTACGPSCCATGLSCCNNTSCRDLRTDNAHCGACNQSCGGGKVCRNGRCVCPEPLRDCGGICVDVSSDQANCGRCGRPCRDGICRNGMCECLSGQQRCPDGTCCAATHPVCCNDPFGCCPTQAPVCCLANAVENAPYCCPAGKTCCEAGSATRGCCP